MAEFLIVFASCFYAVMVAVYCALIGVANGYLSAAIGALFGSLMLFSAARSYIRLKALVAHGTPTT